MKNEKIGFMGLGDQGKYMAVTLLRKNKELYVGYTPGHAEASTAELVELGAKKVSPKELGEVCDIIFLCLPNGEKDEAAILEEDGIASGVTPGTLLVDHCSMEPERARRIAEKLAEKGAGFLEAPVSGGSQNAKKGTMIFIVAGEESDYRRAVPYFDMMGKDRNYVGPVGCASISKYCSQLMLMGNTVTMMETMTFAVKMGLDPEKLWKALRNGLAGSAAMEFYLPMILEDPDIETGNFVNIFKDVRNALRAADEVNCPMPVASNIHNIYRHMMNNGRNVKLDTTSLIDYWEEGAGVKVRYQKKEEDEVQEAEAVTEEVAEATESVETAAAEQK